MKKNRKNKPKSQVHLANGQTSQPKIVLEDTHVSTITADHIHLLVEPN